MANDLFIGAGAAVSGLFFALTRKWNVRASEKEAEKRGQRLPYPPVWAERGLLAVGTLMVIFGIAEIVRYFVS